MWWAKSAATPKTGLYLAEAYVCSSCGWIQTKPNLPICQKCAKTGELISLFLRLRRERADLLNQRERIAELKRRFHVRSDRKIIPIQKENE